MENLIQNTLIWISDPNWGGSQSVTIFAKISVDAEFQLGCLA